MKKYISDLFFLSGFISLEYGLYLYDPKISLIAGGILLMITGLMVAKNGTN